MTEWKYLYSDIFRLRHIVAAQYLKKLGTVIEIGGYVDPITNYLGRKQNIVVLDERLPQSIYTRRIKHIQQNFPFDFEIRTPQNYGILMLGMHLEMSDEGWQKLFNLINGSKVTVIEVPTEFIPSNNQLLNITTSTNKKVSAQVELDFSGNDFGDLTDSAPPFVKRKIYIFK